MTLEESSIFINTTRLRGFLYKEQFNMTKSDRIIYGTSLLTSCGEVIKDFVLAFTIKHKRESYLEEAIGWFSVVRTDIQFCMENNLIHFKGNERVELIKLIASIDEDMCKWQASIARKIENKETRL